MMNWEELVERKKQAVGSREDIFKGKVFDTKTVKELLRRGAKKGRSFRSLVGKEIVIKKIEFQGDKAIVTVEVDGQTKTVETADKLLIRRWLIDFKAALDLGAEGIKVKVLPVGKSAVKFE